MHRLIGETLANKKKDLLGREVRFLRQELLLSQATLAKLLGVTEQTVHRWETGKADIPKPAEAWVRSLYLAQFADDGEINVRAALEKLADLENELDSFDLRKTNSGSWQLVPAARAA